ncbi:MAG: PPC domain-containing protein [Planctomycetota bacterium]
MNYIIRLYGMLLVSAMFSLVIVQPVPVTGHTTSAAPHSPSLTLITPRGVQRGGEYELNFRGARLQDSEEVFLYDSGITVTAVEVVDNANVKVKITVDENCRLGEHVAQIRTRSGISDYRSFYVGALPSVEEAEGNNSLNAAQKIEQNVTVAGVVGSEDVDYFAVDAVKGQRLSVEIEGIRLGFMFDPFIAILDQDRFELAVSDDTPLLKQDGFVSVDVPEDGTYFVMVRESSYGGNGNSRYRLHVGDFPRPGVAYPAGGPAGQTADVTLIGDPHGPVATQLPVPDSYGFRDGLFYEDDRGMTPSPIPFRISPLENVLEVEPNNNFDQCLESEQTMVVRAEPAPASDEVAEAGTCDGPVDGEQPEEAAPVQPAHELPRAFNGIIQSDGDHDYFSFEARKDQVFDVECFARRIGSGLDPVIHVFGPDKKSIVGDDDSRRPDCYVRFTAPADGRYFVRVMDHLRRGREDFVYRVEFTPVEPELRFQIPRVDRYSQQRQTIVVPQGNRFATRISATREDFGGELKLLSDSLPEGVRMIAPPMVGNLSEMPVVFEADESAVVGGHLMNWQAAKTDDSVSGHFFNLADFALGNPNNTRYYGCTVDRVGFAVVEKVPFRVDIVQPQVPMVKNGMINLKIQVHRDEGFEGRVLVQFPFRTPGVGTRTQIEIPADQTEANYPLNANGNAQLGKFPVYVIARGDADGQMWVSSQMADLEIAEPLVTASIKRTVLDQGQTAEMVCEFNQQTPFEGEATLQLMGLPPGVTVEQQTFTSDMTELRFNVVTTAETPIRLHKGIFCRVTITRDREPIASNTGWTELQVRRPQPPEEQTQESDAAGE